MTTAEHAKATATLKARAMLATLSIAQLCEQFTLTDSRIHEAGVCDVRGWLNDELESRNEADFIEWMESNDPKATPADFFCK